MMTLSICTDLNLHERKYLFAGKRQSPFNFQKNIPNIIIYNFRHFFVKNLWLKSFWMTFKIPTFQHQQQGNTCLSTILCLSTTENDFQNFFQTMFCQEDQVVFSWIRRKLPSNITTDWLRYFEDCDLIGCCYHEIFFPQNSEIFFRAGVWDGGGPSVSRVVMCGRSSALQCYLWLFNSPTKSQDLN